MSEEETSKRFAIEDPVLIISHFDNSILFRISIRRRQIGFRNLQQTYAIRGSRK